jgi:hypothetical protein
MIGSHLTEVWAEEFPLHEKFSRIVSSISTFPHKICEGLRPRDMARSISHKISEGVMRCYSRNERDDFSTTDSHLAARPSYLLALSDWDEH